MKIIQTLLNCVVGVVVAGLMAVFLLPRFFGYRPYMVVSASMQQSFPVGSLIFVRDASPEDIRVGDPITFHTGTLTITHRVIEIRGDERVFITKGDNNDSAEVTPFDNLDGKALDFCIPGLGYFAAWFVTLHGRFISALILLSMGALSIVTGKLAELNDTDAEDG